MNNIVPWKMETAVKWEVQVEKALSLSSAERFFKTDNTI
jgi:hypothetical protein